VKVNLQAAHVAEQACNKLGLPMDVLSAAKETAVNIDKLQILSGRNPQTVAGVALYMVT